MFKISDKVVCVRDADQSTKDPVKSGVVYVVRAIVDGNASDRAAGRYWGVRLVGKFPGYNILGEEKAYNPDRFRLLSEVQEENRLKATAEATT